MQELITDIKGQIEVSGYVVNASINSKFFSCKQKHAQENWFSMIDTVKTLSTKYGLEKGAQGNEIGTVTVSEAKEALRTHKGNVWAAVTECVDQRKKKVSFTLYIL